MADGEKNGTAPPPSETTLAEVESFVRTGEPSLTDDDLRAFARAVARAPKLEAVTHIARLTESVKPSLPQKALSAVSQILGGASPPTQPDRAWHALEILLEECPPRRLPHFEEALRSSDWEVRFPASPDFVVRWMTKSPTLRTLALTTFHRNGYLREAAVRRLMEISTGDELPYLILRRNDWVPEIRVVATDALHARLRPDYAARWVRDLELVLCLARRARGDHRPLVELVFDLLKLPGVRRALRAGLDDPDREVRRTCFSLAFDAGLHEEEPSLFERALREVDPPIRHAAAREIRGGGDDTLEEWLPRLLRDRSFLVRREGWLAVLERRPDRAFETLGRALLDPGLAAREFARFHLKAHGVTDFARIYREALSGTEAALHGVRRIRIAVQGLAECGQPEDAERIEALARHPAAQVRCAVIRALSRLRPRDVPDLFQRSLADDSASVVRAARDALSRRLHAVDPESLFELFESDARAHVKRAILHLFWNLGKWESLYYLLLACLDPNPAIAIRAHEYVEHWREGFNRRLSIPNDRERARLETAVDRCKTRFDSSFLENLRFYWSEGTK